MSQKSHSREYHPQTGAMPGALRKKEVLVDWLSLDVCRECFRSLLLVMMVGLGVLALLDDYEEAVEDAS